MAFSLFCFSEREAKAESLHPAQELGLSAAASSAKSLAQGGFDFKNFENKPVLGSLHELVVAIRGPGAPGEAWGWTCRVRAEALATVLDRAKLKGGKTSGAYAPVTLFRTYRFIPKAAPAESAELKPFLEKLRSNASERKDEEMIATLAKVTECKDAAELAGTVRGLSYFVKPQYARDWARFAEAVSALSPAAKTPGTSPGSLSLGLSAAETEKYLKLIDNWEPIEEARAVGFLAAGQNAADEKESVEAAEDGVAAIDSGEEDEDE